MSFGARCASCASFPHRKRNGQSSAPRHTLEKVVAPLRSPLRARVERKQDLANIIGKLGRDCRRGRNQDVTVEGIDLGVARREELTIGSKS